MKCEILYKGKRQIAELETEGERNERVANERELRGVGLQLI
jgi:hypothetical protein